MGRHARTLMIVAGEASGDHHAAGLVRALHTADPDLRFFGIGGDRLAAAGVVLRRHIRDMALVGFTEILAHLPRLYRTLRDMRALLRERRPDGLILVDYPAFNLRLGATAKKLGIPVYWYISPQVWAWGRGRIQKIAHIADALGVILPFEADLYKDTGLSVEFVGHPLLEQVTPTMSRSEFFQAHNLPESTTLVGLLPGSRTQEVTRLLPTLVGAMQRLRQDIDQVAVLVGRAPGLDPTFYDTALPGGSEVRLVENTDYNLMAHADLLICASGTVTLEAGILHTPMIIVYQVSAVTYWLGRLLVDVPHLGLVNLLAGREIAPELLWKDCREDRIADMAAAILRNPDWRERMRRDLESVHRRLGPPDASRRASQMVLDMLKPMENTLHRSE